MGTVSEGNRDKKRKWKKKHVDIEEVEYEKLRGGEKKERRKKKKKEMPIS